MYKLALKLLLITLICTGAGLLVSGGDKVSAATAYCPNGYGIPDNWGNDNNAGGQAPNKFASLVIRAETQRGDPLNPQFGLHSSVDTGGDQAQIYKVPVGSGGSTSDTTTLPQNKQADFKVGAAMSGNGGLPNGCPGWLSVASGADDHIGNGWVLNCHSEGGAKDPAQFWFSNIANPGGQAGRWELYDANNVQISSNVNADPPHKFRVYNGSNTYFKLVWVAADWNLTPTTDLVNHTDGTARRGDTVIFKHNVYNQGSGNATYVWSVEEGKPQGPFFQRGTLTSIASLVRKGDSSPSNLQVSYPVPSNAAIGSQYCERIRASDGSGPGKPDVISDYKCVKIVDCSPGDPGCGGPSPTSPKNSQSCTNIELGSDPSYRYNGQDHPTQMHVRVYGFNPDGGSPPSPYYGTSPGIDTIANHNPIGSGQVGKSDQRNYTNLTPVSSVIYIQRIKQWQSTEGKWNEYSNTTQAITCYSATCSLSIDGNIPGDPNGVQAGSQFTAHMTITNTDGDSDLPSDIQGHTLGIYGGNNNGDGSDWGFSQNYDQINSNQSDQHDITLSAPNDTNQHTLSAHAGYSGLFDFGSGECSMKVNVYQHFTLKPHASSQLDDSECPTQVNYPIGVQQLPDQYMGPIGTVLRGYLTNKDGTTVSSVNYPGNYGNYDTNPPPTWAITPVQLTCKDRSQLAAGQQYCARSYIDAGTGFVGPGGVLADVHIAYSDEPPSCDHVTNKPFFKTYNSALNVQNGVTQKNGGCSANSSNTGLLAGWNNNADTGTDGARLERGSGSQLSNLALLKITGVASAQTDIRRSPIDLAFANTAGSTTSSSSPILGGSFGNTPSCISPPSPGNSSGNHQYSGNTIIYASTISDSQMVSVDGDAYIRGDITYNTVGRAIGNTPSFTLVATGNIYVDPSVTELDGSYIAQPKDDGTRGNIYTCASAVSPTQFQPNNDFTACKNQLLVSGSFTANKVKMLRTFGSLRDEIPQPPVLAVAPTPRTPQIALAWSSNGAIPGYNCLQIAEPSDPDTWNDNFLCQPPGSNVGLAWTYFAGNPSPSGNPYDGRDSLGDIQARGFTNCTQWNVPEPADHNWGDNWLCANKNIGLQFFGGNLTSPTENCVNVYEGSDGDANWNHGGYFVCAAYSAGDSGQAALPERPYPTPTCSNAGNRPSATSSPYVYSTCAAEVFQFSPEQYIAVPAAGPPNNGARQYDAITSLPPVL